MHKTKNAQNTRSHMIRKMACFRPGSAHSQRKSQAMDRKAAFEHARLAMLRPPVLTRGKSSSQLRKKTRGQEDDLLYKDSLLRPSSKMVSLD
jgi:hypothetical protein